MRHTRIYTIISLLITTFVLSSCLSERIYKGNKNYNDLAYAKAIPFYEKVFEKKPEEVGANLADSYVRMGESEKAELVYNKMIEAGHSDKVNYYQYAQVLRENGRYDQAELVLENFLANHEDEGSRKLFENINPTFEKDENVWDSIEYVLNEIQFSGFTNYYSPIEYDKGLLFVADKPASKKQANPWTGNSYLELYYTEQDDEGFKEPSLLIGAVNGKYHEGPSVITKDGKTLYFTRNNYLKKKLISNNDKENNLKIYSATLENDEWNNIKELPFNNNDYSVAHPAITPDGNTMVFSSDMPGGFGGNDLYISNQVNGVWSEPTNLGKKFNTPGNEVFPTIDSEGNLYFSSNGHNSIGGLDVFYCELIDGEWLAPVNMETPINSSKDDFSFIKIEGGAKGYLSSSRSGSDKIYTVDINILPPPPPVYVFTLSGTVMHKNTNEPLDSVRVILKNEDTGERTIIVTNETGGFYFPLEMETNYLIIVAKENFLKQTEVISTVGIEEDKDFIRNFLLEEIIIEKPIEIENIYYDYNKWDIRADAALELDKVVKILEDNPNIDIELGSHTDSRGDDRYNQQLSEKRAKAVVEYLVDNGIEESRLTYRGYGESQIRNKCRNGVKCSDEEHEYNRRTEFKITKVNE